MLFLLSFVLGYYVYSFNCEVLYNLITFLNHRVRHSDIVGKNIGFVSNSPKFQYQVCYSLCVTLVLFFLKQLLESAL